MTTLKNEAKPSVESKVEDALWNFVASQKRPLTEAEILKGVAGRKLTKVVALRRLAQDLLRRSGTGKKGDPFLYSVVVPISNPVASYPVSQNGPTLQSDEPLASTGAHYKSYTLPNGKLLNLSKEEFDHVVEVFKLLIRQRDEIAGSKDQGENEIFEP